MSKVIKTPEFYQRENNRIIYLNFILFVFSILFLFSRLRSESFYIYYPDFFAISFFFFSLRYPDKISYIPTTIIGFINDIVLDFPIGISIFAYNMYVLLLSSNSRFFEKRNFVIFFFGFSVTYLLLVLTKAFAINILHGINHLDIMKILLSYMLNCCYYCFFHILFNKIMQFFEM